MDEKQKKKVASLPSVRRKKRNEHYYRTRRKKCFNSKQDAAGLSMSSAELRSRPCNLCGWWSSERVAR
jgi:hypothetical protein